jgi:hypothetical protein
MVESWPFHLLEKKKCKKAQFQTIGKLDRIRKNGKSKMADHSKNRTNLSSIQEMACILDHLTLGHFLMILNPE